MVPGIVRKDDEHPNYPVNDNGLNFVYSLVTLSFRMVAVPFRFVIGVVSAKRVDDECAKRGLFIDEYNPDVVEEVLDEYGERFYRGNRR